jgi:hypothetical protein
MTALGDSLSYEDHGDDDTIYFVVEDMDARMDPNNPQYAPYGPLYFVWLLSVCVKYTYVGNALRVPLTALTTVKGAEDAVAVLLNSLFDAVHDAAAHMNIGTFFQADLYQDKDWQETYGTSNEDTAQVHALPACMRCRSYLMYVRNVEICVGTATPLLTPFMSAWAAADDIT